MTPQTHSQISGILYPDGHLVVHSELFPEVTAWRALGWVRQAGVAMTFIRAEVPMASWTALVPTDALAADADPVEVTLSCRPVAPAERLDGWPRFC